MLFYGAGSSAVGVALAIQNLLQNKGGLSAEDARKVLPLMLGLLSKSAAPRGQGCISLRCPGSETL